MTPLYLDHNATTQLDPQVREAIRPWLEERFGNPASRDHAWGWDAAEAVVEVRLTVAALVGAQPTDIILTSSATEGINTVIHCFVGYNGWRDKKIITCATEHDAVLSPIQYAARCAGVEVSVLPVDVQGYLDLEDLEAALNTDKNILVAVMAANNEIGTIHPIRTISKITHNAGAHFLCDITQAVGKMPIDIYAYGIDFAAFSAHKMYGPKGVGALVIRKQSKPLELEPLILGGGQEFGMRGGTLNVPGIVGFGEACRISSEVMAEEVPRIRKMRDRLEEAILAEVPDTWVNGDRANRICNTSNIGFRGIDARTLIRDMHDIAVSTQAACSSGNSGPSHVLKAIGLSDEDAYSCIRFSLGRFTTEDEIDYTIRKVITSAHKLRQSRLSPS